MLARSWCFVFLLIYDLTPDNFLDLALDGVHHPDPTQLIRHLHLLGYTCLLRHLRNHRIQQVLRLHIGLMKIIIQSAAEQQPCIETRPVFFQVIHTSHAILIQRITRINLQIGEIVIAMKSIVKAVLLIMNMLREFRNIGTFH